jgi:hypothetical protein
MSKKKIRVLKDTHKSMSANVSTDVFFALLTHWIKETRQITKMVTAAASHAIGISHLIIEVKINTNWNSINFLIREKSLNKSI